MTTQYFYCTRCHQKSVVHHKLFDTLNNFSNALAEECSSCGELMEVRLRPDFQLGAGGDEYRVINAFIPEKLESWLGEDEEEVTFFPFLVVLERAADSKRFYWLPYWHLVGRNARHGQYATFLDQAQFDSLVTQAQQTTLAPA